MMMLHHWALSLIRFWFQKIVHGVQLTHICQHGASFWLFKWIPARALILALALFVQV